MAVGETRESFIIQRIKFLARWEQGVWWASSPTLPRTTFVARTLGEAKRMVKEYIEDMKAEAK